VGEGVTELVRMHRRQAGVGATAFKHLSQPRVGHPAFLAQPQPLGRCVVVPSAETQISSKRIRGLRPERTRSIATAFA
jgi:hypothetical protein